MRYFKEYDENGFVTTIGAGDALNGIEITQEEYERLYTEMWEKVGYAEQVYRQEISIGDVPAEWQEEVQARVDEMVAEVGPYDTTQISDAEALAIITGGDTA